MVRGAKTYPIGNIIGFPRRCGSGSECEEWVEASGDSRILKYTKRETRMARTKAQA